MFDTNIPRWIATSINKHFDDNKQGLTLYFDSNHPSSSDYIELRLSGPTIDVYTPDYIRCDCIINILITSYTTDDDYEIYRMVGIVTKAFRPICIYKYGDGPDDDQTLLGTLVLTPETKLDVVNFGVVDPSSGFKRSFVEASYYMYL